MARPKFTKEQLEKIYLNALVYSHNCQVKSAQRRPDLTSPGEIRELEGKLNDYIAKTEEELGITFVPTVNIANYEPPSNNYS